MKLLRLLRLNQQKSRRKQDCPVPQSASTYWKISTLKEECKAVRWQFEQLMNVLEGKSEMINDLCAKLELIASFTIIIEMEVGYSPELVLTKEIVEFIPKLEVEVGFDMYID